MHRTYSVPISTFVVLGVFSFGLSLLLMFAPVFYSVPPPSVTKIFIFSTFPIGVLAAVFWWLSRFQLTITPDTLIYSSLFSGKHTVRLSEITDCRLMSQNGQFAAKWIEVKTSAATLVINFRVFSREARNDLFKLIKTSDHRRA
ncbi:MAG TPA: hypothetical protein VGO57_08005 [Verrucomicrobiae bacterium]|jgi:hypothetical protein